MTKYVQIALDDDYKRNEFEFCLLSDVSHLGHPQKEIRVFKIPENIEVDKVGPTGYVYMFQDGNLKLERVFPFEYRMDLEGTGLGSYFLSRMFELIYLDSLKENSSLNPNDDIIVETEAQELIDILKNRGFKSDTSDIFINNIVDAAEKSKKILKERNWY